MANVGPISSNYSSESAQRRISRRQVIEVPDEVMASIGPLLVAA
jgi:hypothetical protein